MLSRSFLLKIAFNTLLGIVAIFIWLKFVNLQEIGQTLQNINLIFVIPIFFFIWTSIAIRALRLRVFLSPFRKIKLWDIVFLCGAATMLNFLIPIRAGDISKGIYLSRNYDIPAGRSVVWIFLDRFIDFLLLLICTPVLLLLIPNNLDSRFIWIIALISGSLALTAYTITFKKKLAEEMFGFVTQLLILGFLKKYFKKIYIHLLESFTILKRHPKDLFYLSAITMLAFLSDAAIWFFTFLSLGSLQSLAKMFLAQFLSAVTYLIPAAPGYIGSAEASGLVVFTGVLGIDRILASSMVIVFHACLAIFVIANGIFCLYLLKMNPEDLFKKVLKKES